MYQVILQESTVTATFCKIVTTNLTRGFDIAETTLPNVTPGLPDDM